MAPLKPYINYTMSKGEACFGVSLILDLVASDVVVLLMFTAWILTCCTHVLTCFKGTGKGSLRENFTS